MNIDNPIASEIFEGLSFTNQEYHLIAAKFEQINLKKGEMLIHTKDIVYNQYYVHSGCLRAYFIDDSGKEHTVQFAIKDWWITDFTAFFTTSKALMNIECIQDAIVYKISQNNTEHLYVEIPKIETYIRKKMEKRFAAFQKRILSSLSQSAKERYKSFLNTYPGIERNVKNYHIASYLGITAESLSRIRKEFT